MPGYSDERVHLFLATELAAARQELDADEVIAVHRMPLAQALDMVTQGEIKDAKSICGLLLAHKCLNHSL